MAGMHQHNKVLGASASEAVIAGRARRRATDLVDPELPPAALDLGTTLAAPPRGGSEAGGLPPGTRVVLNLVEVPPLHTGQPSSACASVRREGGPAPVPGYSLKVMEVPACGASKVNMSTSCWPAIGMHYGDILETVLQSRSSSQAYA